MPGQNLYTENTMNTMDDINQDREAAGILSNVVETALLVGVEYSSDEAGHLKNHLDELEGLIQTMGLRSLGCVPVKLKAPQPRYLVGSGKAEEIAEMAEELAVDCIVFDESLSPSQQRNWEKLAKCAVIDRQEVILDIFAARAQTKEATLQVALARMQYSLPRLTRAWTHLSRQRGGAKGTRGEGETQLEVDRRLVLEKIGRFKRELKKVQRNRETQRKQREGIPVPTAAIVGYTNAGKSSLLKRMSGSEVFIEDKLFATLDPTTRRVKFAGGKEMLVTDTVGFIRKLPHSLVEAFKSTLEESVVAHFLIHVLDASNPEVEAHHKTTMEVLKELQAADKPVLTVFNKTDIADSEDIQVLKSKYPEAIFISIHENSGIDGLEQELEKLLYADKALLDLKVPVARGDILSLLHAEGKIVEQCYEHDYVILKAYAPDRIHFRLEGFLM